MTESIKDSFFVYSLSLLIAITSLNYSLSKILKTDGNIGWIDISSRNCIPELRLGKRIESNSYTSGLNLSLIVASTITPKIPSDPIIIFLIEGPDEVLGVLLLS